MDVVVITFDGEIGDFPVLVQSVDNLIADGTRFLVIDLHTLPFINSAALGYLVKARANLERLNGELVLARVQPAIQNILDMTGLDEVFPAFPSVEEAVGHLGGELGEGQPARGKKPVRHSRWR